MLYAIGFIGLFTIGGLTGLFLAAVGLDVHVTDTYFIVAHFHYIMVGGTIMGYLGGLHYWWPKISGRLYNEWLAKISAGDHLRRLQPDVLPAVHPRLPRHAAPLPRLSAGVPGAERAVVGGRVDPRRRLPDSDGLPDVVAALRPASPARTRGARSASSGRRRRRRRPRTSRRRRSSPGTPTTTRRRWRAMLPETRARTHAHHPALAHHFDNLEQQSEAATLGMWVFLVTEVLFFGGLFTTYIDLPQLVSRGVRRRQPRARRHARHHQHGRPDHQQPDDGAGGARGAAGPAQAADDCSWSLTMVLGAAFLGIKSVEYYHKFVEHHVPGPGFPVRGGVLPARADLLLALLRHDRAARAAHDHRPRHHAGDARAGRGTARSPRSTPARSRSAASTGTSSTSSGSSCSRCST